MKKPLLIVIGIILIIGILAAMAYFLYFGTPKSADEIFTNFGIGNAPEFVEKENTGDEFITDDQDPPLNRLTQITLKAVAGAVVLQDKVRYVERGTGHIYDVDFMGVSDSLISGTTIPKSVRASFSPTGNHVAITSDGTSGYETIVGEISSSGFNGVALPAGSREVSFIDEGLVSYLLNQPQGAVAYTYDINTKKSTRLFSLPLRDVEVLWGDQNFVYTTPSNKQTGYFYAVKKGVLDYATESGVALMGIPYYGGILTTRVANDVLETMATATSGVTFTLPISVITSKCVAHPIISGRLYCGAEATPLEGTTHPDAWYKGLVTMNDGIWEINGTEQTVTNISEPLSEVGRQIDIQHIGIGADGRYLYIISKNDSSLWLFNLVTD